MYPCLSLWLVTERTQLDGLGRGTHHGGPSKSQGDQSKPQWVTTTRSSERAEILEILSSTNAGIRKGHLVIY